MENQITPEQKAALEREGRKFFMTTFWNGAHHGLMLFVLNFIVTMGAGIFFGGNKLVWMFGCIGTTIFVLSRMNKIHRGDLQSFQEKIKKILDK